MKVCIFFIKQNTNKSTYHESFVWTGEIKTDLVFGGGVADRALTNADS